MRLFRCPGCNHLVFFENSTCVRCGGGLAFDPGSRLIAASPFQNASQSLCQGGAPGCNWLAHGTSTRCLSCAMTVLPPPPAAARTDVRWSRIEAAKRRLLYTLLSLKLPLGGLGFSFPETGLTGHAGGLITVVLSEADDAERERRRVELYEPLRTLVGHFRHESGHFFFDKLILGSSLLCEVRATFGDERAEYGQALHNYHASGPCADWSSSCITAYATAHPFEDWAETWAHYLHMIDAVELLVAYGLRLSPTTVGPQGLAPADPAAVFAVVPRDPLSGNFDDLLAAWTPLTCLANSLNRSLGLQDWYPFVMCPAVIAKLRLIHRVVAEHRTGALQLEAVSHAG